MFHRYDIFLSYSHKDSSSTDPFVAELRARGYRVFYDQKSIAIGEFWKRRLGKALKQSRVCVVCWSQHARRSEFVIFEYSRAEALKKTVLPWMVDSTPLPAMIERQALTDRDPVRAAQKLSGHVGPPLSRTRIVRSAFLTLLLAALITVMWWNRRPLTAFEFGGRVVDSETGLPIQGVHVESHRLEAKYDRCVAYTDTNGRYVLRISWPKPKYLHLVFVKAGYKAEAGVNVATDGRDGRGDADMVRIR